MKPYDYLIVAAACSEPCLPMRLIKPERILRLCRRIPEYLSLRFEHRHLTDIEDFQDNAVVNYTDRETPYTRVIKHKHFEFGTQPKTVITREYPVSWQEGMEPYYPVNDEKNQALYQKYAKLAEKEENVIFGGRLGEYKYYDMDKVIESAMKKAKELF